MKERISTKYSTHRAGRKVVAVNHAPSFRGQNGHPQRKFADQAERLAVDTAGDQSGVISHAATGSQIRQTFVDNLHHSRYELLVGGRLAGYIKYTKIGQQVVLTDSVERPGFRDQGIDIDLMNSIVVDARFKHLELTPQCPMAFSFLADHPQHRAPGTDRSTNTATPSPQTCTRKAH